jgi:CheY-like chemotaxis protein
MARILVVEDNEINQELIIRRLQKRGYEVDMAENGVDGLEMARTTRPGIVLLDMSLPEMDGWEVASRIRADETIKHMPIIALTAHAMDGDRQKALDAGCDEYETKPIDFPALLEKIERLILKD